MGPIHIGRRHPVTDGYYVNESIFTFARNEYGNRDHLCDSTLIVLGGIPHMNILSTKQSRGVHIAAPHGQSPCCRWRRSPKEFVSPVYQ